MAVLRLRGLHGGDRLERVHVTQAPLGDDRGRSLVRGDVGDRAVLRVIDLIALRDIDAVEFRELEIPAAFYPNGGTARESWRTLFYANLIHSFIGEILSGDSRNEADFGDGAWVQEVINAVERSFRERRWVPLPLT